MGWFVDPDAIAAEYASEEAFRERSLAVRDLVEGVDDEAVLREKVRAARPHRLLDVGAGLAHLCVWAKAELGAEVDLSARMAELAARAGVRSVVADMRDLPFADASFDCVVAAMCLYHVPDPETAIGEAARVLDGNGVFVASTGPDDQPDRLRTWERLFHEPVPSVPPAPFSSENGRELLLRHFRQVEQVDCHSALVFPNRDRLVRYVRALPLPVRRPTRCPNSQNHFGCLSLQQSSARPAQSDNANTVPAPVPRNEA